MIGITITGLNDVTKAFKEMEKDELYQSTMNEVADVAYNWLQTLCPVDTGFLLSTTFVTKQKNGFELGATAPYAVYNEFGSIYTPIGGVHSPIPAKYAGFRPFVRPAAYRAMEQLPYIFGQKVVSIWK